MAAGRDSLRPGRTAAALPPGRCVAVVAIASPEARPGGARTPEGSIVITGGPASLPRQSPGILDHRDRQHPRLSRRRTVCRPGIHRQETTVKTPSRQDRAAAQEEARQALRYGANRRKPLVMTVRPAKSSGLLSEITTAGPSWLDPG